MAPRNECQTVVMVKGFCDVLSKCVANITRRDTPSTAVVRIRPEEIAHRSFVWDLLHSVDRPHMVESIN